jgi:glycerate 2-kinase
MPLHDLARQMTAAALAAVDPERLARDELIPRGERFGAALAIGKAATPLARGAREALEPGARRLLIRPHNTPGLLDPGWEQTTGGHPLPDRQSVAAGERLERWLAGIPPRPLLALISGGASACVEIPAPGLTLEDLAATQRALLASGLPIQKVNAVRKHLSRLKGGGALRATGGRLPRILALLLSDVPGDDPAAIASGPFCADPTTYAEALAAVESLPVPEPVRRHLAAGARGELPETVKRDPPEVETVLLGSVRTAVEAAVSEARRHGFHAVAGELSGEAVAAALDLVARGRALGGSGTALVLGGETTVTLRGETGRGGRNQELALAAARELAGGPTEGKTELVFTLATDGEDGPTRSAGGTVDGATWEAVRRAGIDPQAALARHDSRTALAAVPGALLETGPTGTNVGDLAVYLRVG